MKKDKISLPMSEDSDLLPKIHYESLAMKETSYWWHMSRVNWAEWVIRTHFPDPSLLSVLDYGCGTGGFLHSLNGRLNFKSCMGVDASSQAVQHARKYGSNYDTVSLCDLRPVRDHDLILLMDVLEHIEDDSTFIKHLLMQSKLGAHILLSVPALPSLYSDWDYALGHHRRYTKRGLCQTLEEAGGEVVSVTYIFSYLVIPVFLKRIFFNAQYGENNCEFSPVSTITNRTLLAMNRLEISASRITKPPFGNSLICMFKSSFHPRT